MILIGIKLILFVQPITIIMCTSMFKIIDTQIHIKKLTIA